MTVRPERARPESYLPQELSSVGTNAAAKATETAYAARHHVDTRADGTGSAETALGRGNRRELETLISRCSLSNPRELTWNLRAGDAVDL
jgi:hypothetical protein